MRVRHLLYCFLLSVSCHAVAQPSTQPAKVAHLADRDSFFFIQISDSHVYDRKSDFFDYSSPSVPWFIPEFVVQILTVRQLEGAYGEGAIEQIRDELRPWHPDIDDMWDHQVYGVYSEEMRARDRLFGSIPDNIQSAISEVGALSPDFIIATGDLVLESNTTTPEVVRRWFDYYRRLTDALGVPVINTIGNNEIVGIQNPDISEGDPGFGKAVYLENFGDPAFGFTIGDFHFMALDTHIPAPKDDNPSWWSFETMPRDVKAWFEEELASHQDKTLVVLNHEPFHVDPDWPFEEPTHADDEGLFEEHGVDYVLTGHTHFRSNQLQEGIYHMTTGALSGFRWMLSAAVHSREYRLFLALEGELYSVTKQVGERFAGLAYSRSEDRRVMALGDVAGPYVKIEVQNADGEILPHEQLNAYFFVLPEGARRILTTAADGNVMTTTLCSDDKQASAGERVIRVTEGKLLSE